MFNSTSDFEKAMRDFLMTIKKEEKISTLLEKYGDRDGGDALAKCINKGYVLGIRCRKTVGGTNKFDIIGNIRLSFSGLAFLERT